MLTPRARKPYAESAEQNRGPILALLRELFAGRRRVLELGSGTGQHAVHFAAALPHLRWLPSDLPEQLPGIRLWRDEASLANLEPPLALDAAAPGWKLDTVDAIFSANTFHIMSWPQVRACLGNCARVLEPGGLLTLYGPFNFGGRYTSDSNASFDLWLKARDPDSGIRNFEDLDREAAAVGLDFMADYPMPANNRILVWRRSD